MMSRAHTPIWQTNDSGNRLRTAIGEIPTLKKPTKYAKNESADASTGSAHPLKFVIPRPGVLDFPFADASSETQSRSQIEFIAHLDSAITSFTTQLRKEIVERQKTELLLQQIHLYPRTPPAPPSLAQQENVQSTGCETVNEAHSHALPRRKSTELPAGLTNLCTQAVTPVVTFSAAPAGLLLLSLIYIYCDLVTKIYRALRDSIYRSKEQNKRRRCRLATFQRRKKPRAKSTRRRINLALILDASSTPSSTPAPSKFYDV